jgi:two-component system phosphate regulon sensor histidine kinase PhoR
VERELLTALVGLIVGSLLTLAFVRSRARLDARLEITSPPALPEPLESVEAVEDRVLRALPFAAIALDPHGRVRLVNPAAEALFAIVETRAIGRALIEVVPSVEFERLIETADEQQPKSRDVRIIDAERERVFGIAVRRLEHGTVAIAADRTELVNVERARRDFVSNVSHELRTPLAAIKLMIETVLLSDDDAEARAMFLPRVAREVDRMVALVEDLLELARSESGRIALRRERIDLGEVATATVNTFAQRADRLAVELDLDAPEAVELEADRDKLMQVAMNLVDNALRYTPPGGTVTVSVARERGRGVLRVRDTGEGIPYNDLERIFDRFYVVNQSRSRDRSGTGLGLSIARELIEAHGGSIGVESVFGEGATFTCRLPLLDAPKIKAT